MSWLEIYKIEHYDVVWSM